MLTKEMNEIKLQVAALDRSDREKGRRVAILKTKIENLEKQVKI